MNIHNDWYQNYSIIFRENCFRIFSGRLDPPSSRFPEHFVTLPNAGSVTGYDCKSSTLQILIYNTVFRFFRRRNKKSKKNDTHSDRTVFIIRHNRVLRRGVGVDVDVALLRPSTFWVPPTRRPFVISVGFF